ncbi:hypothetical protein BE17_27710 [Sorangium cellulosum]|uniref:Uncharacterized protein n=1 Tax=Sorangium cellulosum TaxID=56 RepID=A0A150RX72_SORCE|nr:hypothetical protein BE17_27710 [Sorangium cellulosum]
MDEAATVRRELQAGWLAMSVLLGSTAATTSARGEERAKPGPSEESERDRAVRDFQEGRRAHVAGRLEEAEFFYLRAWARLKSYDIATNLGQVQLQLNKPASAAKYLAFGVRTVGPEIDPERLARMQALLAEAKAQVGTLRVRVTNVRDAEVLVDGQRLPAEEMKHELYVEPGQHVLVIRRAGYEDTVRQLTTVPEGTEEITIELKPKAAMGRGAAGAPVNGEANAKAAAAERRGQEPRSWGPVIALGVASAAGLGLAVGFTVASNTASSDARAQRQAILRVGAGCSHAPSALADRCAQLARTTARSERLRDFAGVTYVASGTVALAALVVALWPRTGAPQGSVVRVVPELRANTAGVLLLGAWQ